MFKYYLLTVSCCLLLQSARAQDLPWWNQSVFYEIFVRSFYDSDGDGTGDLQGLIDKLDYLNDGDPATSTDLGISGIWLMPIQPSPSTHGYDATDYRNINPDYGSLATFSELVEACHARGIRIIIDYVMNHCSNQHPWFQAAEQDVNSPYRDWFRWENEYPGYLGPWGQPVWHAANGYFYYGLFWSGMPDLNYATQAVQNEMLDISRFWLDSLHVDGFRLDAIQYLFEDGQQLNNVPETYDFLRTFRNYYKAISPEAMTVGEVWSSTENVATYVDSTGIDFCFEFELSDAIGSGVLTHQPSPIRDRISEVLDAYPVYQFAPFLSNHDQERIFGVLNESTEQMKQAAAICLTLPGIPFLYYGEEIGMTGSNSDGTNRSPMQWTSAENAGFTTGSSWFPVDAGYVTHNVVTQQADPASLWNWYRGLIKARNNFPALSIGDYEEVTSGQYNLLSYARSTADEMIVALFNLHIFTLNQPAISLAASQLPAGEYFVSDLLTGTQLGLVLIDANGGFTDWNIPLSLEAFATALLLITPNLSIDETAGLVPDTAQLIGACPNPFNSSTFIGYDLSARSNVTLQILDLRGRNVATLLQGVQNAGPGRVRWNSGNLPSGIYWVRLESSSGVQTKKIMLLK